MRLRIRHAVWMVAALMAAVSLVGCKSHSVNRLTGTGSTSAPAGEIPQGPPADPHTGNPADPGVPGDPGKLPPPDTGTPPAPQPSPSPTPAVPRTETYSFDGYVIAGGTLPAGVAVGDKVTGTFRINLDRPLAAEFPDRGIYLALEAIQGTVGPSAFAGGEDYIYVADHDALGCALDTAHMTLDGNAINYDLFFFMADGQTFYPDHTLDNLHNLDQHLYRRVDLWFETDPMAGTGFNADIYAFHRIDGPAIAMAAMRSYDYVNVRW